MDWLRLSMKKHENLAFFGLFWLFQSMCNPCAHGSRPEFWEKSIPPQSMKIFFPNPCTVSKNEFFSAKIHVQYMSQKNYKILVSIQVGLKDLFDHNLNTGKVERNFCLNTASIQVGIFFYFRSTLNQSLLKNFFWTSIPIQSLRGPWRPMYILTSLCWENFFGPQSQYSPWEAQKGPWTWLLLTGASVFGTIIDCLHMLLGKHPQNLVKIWWVWRHQDQWHF